MSVIANRWWGRWIGGLNFIDYIGNIPMANNSRKTAAASSGAVSTKTGCDYEKMYHPSLPVS